MTISTISVKSVFNGDGTNNPLNAAMRAFLSSEIKVYAVNPTGSAIGTYLAMSSTVLTETVHYTVTLGSPTPGLVTVTPIAGATDFAAGLEWHIVRDLPRTQIVDYIAAGAFPVEAHERGQDRIVMLEQELDFYRQRSLHLAHDDSDRSLELPKLWDMTSKLLYFDASGLPVGVTVDSVSPGDVVFTAIGRTIAESADADAVLAALLAVKNKGSQASIQAGTNAVRTGIAAATFGTGFFLETDTGRLYYSNGSAWTEQVLDLKTEATKQTTLGRVSLATDSKQLYYGDGSNANLLRAFPPRFLKLDSLSQSYCVRAAAQTVQLNAPLYGRASLPAGSRDQLNWVIATTFTKTLGGTWVAGTGNAGLAAGSIAVGTWYHVFVLTKADGSVDMGFDVNVDGSGLLANANVISAGFTHAQLVFSVRTQDTDAGSRVLIDWICEGDLVYWNQDLGLTEQDNNAVTNGFDWRDAAANQNYEAGQNRPLRRCPTGYKCQADIVVFPIAGLGINMVRPGGAVSVQPDAAVSWPLPNLYWTGINYGTGQRWALTNTSAQVLITSEVGGGSNDQLVISCYGYRHPLYG